MKIKLSSDLLKFLEDLGLTNRDVSILPKDASTRTYYRSLQTKNSFILMDSSKEKSSLINFINISLWLRKKGFSAPCIYHKDLAKGYCILEDFGDHKFSIIQSTKIINKYKVTIDLLASLSRLSPPTKLKYYSKKIFMDELNLFIEWYLFYKKKKDRLALASWENIWSNLFLRISSSNKKSIVLRDFHVDNLFWLNNKQGLKRIGLIDFQDALIGHPCYDLVSLLQDVRVKLSFKRQQDLYNYYIKAVKVDEKLFEEVYFIFGTQRLIKIIGIFNKLKYLHNKSNYMKHIPRSWILLKRNLKYSSLKPLLNWFEAYVFK